MRGGVVRFSHIAGDVFLDLLNTVDWRRSEPKRHDRLETFDDGVAWGVEASVLSDDEGGAALAAATREPEVARREFDRLVEARELAYAALVEGDAAAAERLGVLRAECLHRATLSLGESGWAWREQDPGAITTLADRVLAGLVALGERPDVDRLHQCEDAHCGWVYLDTSPRRNRRWCATSDCGDRNRARAYYARKKAL